MDADEDDESTDTGDSLEAGIYVDGPASSSGSGVICTKWRISEADVPMYRFPSIRTVNDKVLGSPGERCGTHRSTLHNLFSQWLLNRLLIEKPRPIVVARYMARSRYRAVPLSGYTALQCPMPSRRFSQRRVPSRRVIFADGKCQI